MDYNFSWPTVHIDPRLRLSRNIAFIGLLREMSDEVPDDAVLFYLINTDCAGLKDSVFSDLYDSARWAENSTTATPMKELRIPDGLRKMTEGYFFNILLDEIMHIAYCYSDLLCRESSGSVWTLPSKVREALDRVQITTHATVQDHKPAIDALHASICNETIATDTAWRSMRDCESGRAAFWNKQGFDTLSFKQMAKIRQLFDIFHRAMDKMRMDRKRLNPFEWATFCDLLDVMILLTHEGGYTEAANVYTLHEYAKMAEVGRERGRKFNEVWEVSRLRSLYGSAIDRALDFYSKLSPKASILIGRNVLVHFFNSSCRVTNALPMWEGDERNIRRYLEFKRQPVSTAVKLFMKYEVAIHRRKIEEIGYTLRKHNHSCDREECCCDAPCCG